MSEERNPMQKIITKCWQDETYKKKLKADPVAVLQSEGLKVPDGVSVKVVENTDREVTFVIPQAPEQLIENRPDLVSSWCNGWILIGCEMQYQRTPGTKPLRPRTDIPTKMKP